MFEGNGNFYFQRSNGERVLLAEKVDEKTAMVTMHKFLDDHKYKSYYTRCWVDENGNCWYDVGSHSEFFIMSPNVRGDEEVAIQINWE